MTKPREPEALLSAYLADGMHVLPDRVIDSVLDQVHRTRQRRPVFGPRLTRPMFRTTMAAALVAAAVALASATFMILRGLPAVGDPDPTGKASASPSQPVVVMVPTPMPTAAVQSLDFTWREIALDRGLARVAWLGDRFVLVDDSGAVSTSTSGASWQALQSGDPDPGYADLLRGSFATWQDDVIGWTPGGGPDVTDGPPLTAPDVLRIVRPPAEPTETTPFKGRIESIGIGPVGIVVQVHSHLDWDAWVASKLGDDWVSRYEEVSFQDGILEITMKRGRGLKVVWADEGFELGDFQDAGFGWYSPDGVEWTAIPAPAWSPDRDSGLGFPTGFGDVVGVSDGFIARGIDTECTSEAGCAGIWHSADGLTWRNIGNVPGGHERSVLPWMGGALVTDGVGHFDFWTSQGLTELPMAAELPAAWKQANQDNTRFGSGPLGLVTLGKGDDPEILFTPDGVAWDMQAMPAEMEADQRFPDVIVGDRSVLVVWWSGTLDARIPSLWLGAPEP